VWDRMQRQARQLEVEVGSNYTIYLSTKGIKGRKQHCMYLEIVVKSCVDTVFVAWLKLVLVSVYMLSHSFCVCLCLCLCLV
jgi:hypothetical protein